MARSTRCSETLCPAPEEVRRVVLATGKVSLDLLVARGAKAVSDVAVVRVEQLYPWPGEQLASVLARYPQATEVVWAQEEPANMGAWEFVRDRLADDIKGRTLSVVVAVCFGLAGHGQPCPSRPRASRHPRKGAGLVGERLGQCPAPLTSP